LITGENGTGKELIARAVHQQSKRKAQPFIKLNCAAVPHELIESELFGHEKGAFTGAMTARRGKFELAHEGTLFLDEVGDMPQAMQAKLLRVIQEREVRRVGENKTRSIDVRLVAATHRDLKAEVAAGRFREDLYYRLRVVELAVPPLRERPEDIVALARVFLAAACARAQQPAKEFAPEVARRLVDYRWPGNVRELSNAMERAAVLSPGRRIELGDLPPEVVEPVPRSAVIASAGRTLDEVEREHILATLAAVGGNRARAAETLGIGQATLFRKLKAWKELSAA
jgi:DNA-binding NtrC family response regulator